jgi:hypothetical protein
MSGKPRNSVQENTEALMNQESELGWLNLTDNSKLILTSHYVFQQQDRGIFGESHEIIPLRAITTIRLTWRRSRALIVLGALTLMTFLFLLVSSITAAPGEQPFAEQLFNLSSSTVAFVEYGALLAAIALFVLFWLYKSHELQIMAVSGSVGGAPRSYEEAQRFCSLLISELTDHRAPLGNVENEPAESPQATDRDWKL